MSEQPVVQLPGLMEKVVDAARSISEVVKDKTNDHHRYAYVSAEAMLGALRGPLLERGIIVLPELVNVGERPYVTSGGKESMVTTARVKFTLVDARTGERWASDWAGQGDDPADKGLGKAYTNAVKTFLRQVFLLPQGDDPEADAQTDSRASERAPRRPSSNASQEFASDKQKFLVGKLRDEKGDGAFRAALIASGADDVPEDTDELSALLGRLSKARASAVIETLMEKAA